MTDHEKLAEMFRRMAYTLTMMDDYFLDISSHSIDLLEDKGLDVMAVADYLGDLAAFVEKPENAYLAGLFWRSVDAEGAAR